MSINKIKKIAKKILNEDIDVINSSYDINNFPVMILIIFLNL